MAFFFPTTSAWSSAWIRGAGGGAAGAFSFGCAAFSVAAFSWLFFVLGGLMMASMAFDALSTLR